VRVLLSEGKGLEIDWQDGHRSAWSFAWLRDACPCATCNEERNNAGRKPGQPKSRAASLLPMYTPPPRPASAHAVGRYALQFNWEDATPPAFTRGSICAASASAASAPSPPKRPPARQLRGENPASPRSEHPHCLFRTQSYAQQRPVLRFRNPAATACRETEADHPSSRLC